MLYLNALETFVKTLTAEVEIRSREGEKEDSLKEIAEQVGPIQTGTFPQVSLLVHLSPLPLTAISPQLFGMESARC